MGRREEGNVVTEGGPPREPLTRFAGAPLGKGSKFGSRLLHRAERPPTRISPPFQGADVPQGQRGFPPRRPLTPGYAGAGSGALREGEGKWGGPRLRGGDFEVGGGGLGFSGGAPTSAGATLGGLGGVGLFEGWEVLEELCRDGADVVDGFLEGVLGSGGGVLDAGDLADELAGGLFDFVLRGVDASGLAQAFD